MTLADPRPALAEHSSLVGYLMGVAATYIAKLLHRFSWIGYIGLVVVLYVALHMIWDGARQVVVRTGNLEQFNASAPGFLEIGEEEAAHHLGRQRSETSEVPAPAVPGPAGHPR